MNKDPFAKREAEKYENPIPSREFILSVFNNLGIPVNFNQLKKELDLTGMQNEFALRKRLRAMVRDGQLEQINKNFCLKGFINKTKNVDWTKNLDKNKEKLNKKKIVTTTGTLFKENGFNYVAPFFSKDLQQDILIPMGNENDAAIGDGVLVEVVIPLFKWADPIGKILKVLGKATDRKVIINMAIHSLNIPCVWPEELFNKKDLVKPIKTTRTDLKAIPFVTIDGEDAKDFDDAVFCKKNKKGGWDLSVAIADVSYYVEPKTKLDEQALLRGNSVYFPGKVIPMLPEVLSNDLCSLKPNVDRLAMVCEMHISADGKLTKYKFYEALICSKARLTYNQVSDLLQEKANCRSVEKSVLVNLLELENLFLALQQQRQERGAIEFESIDSKMIFNKKGLLIDVKPIKRNIAHKIIEECMLSANVATAKFLEKNKLLSIYRVHEGPTSTKLLDLKAFLKSVGLSLDSDTTPTSKDYCKLLKKISKRKDADVIQMILLRSMCQAMYSSENIGHFGLAYPAYTHFTSPIRRYTDLLVHRHIKTMLHDNDNQTEKSLEKIKEIAEHCSMTERRADEATREVAKACKCLYLTKYVGANFVGIVSGVTKFGLFVEIKDLYIDGLVHINALGSDYFIYDPVAHKLVGEKSGVIYSLGMELQIIVSKVDVNRKRIDFVLQNVKSKNTANKARKKSKNKAKTKNKTKK